MSAIPQRSVSIPPGLAAPALRTGRGPRAAQEFEAQLIGSLLESMEKAFAALPAENTVPGADDYGYLGAQALAQGVASHGGFGIASMILRHLPAHEGRQ